MILMILGFVFSQVVSSPRFIIIGDFRTKIMCPYVNLLRVLPNTSELLGDVKLRKYIIYVSPFNAMICFWFSVCKINL